VRNKLSAAQRRYNLVKTLASSGTLSMRVCRFCQSAGTPDRCKLGDDSDRCLECVRKAVDCNLAPFSPARWARIQRQRAEKSSQVKDTISKLLRLQKELEVLEKKQTDMVEDEIQNISEMEEADTVHAPAVNFDVSSEQLEYSNDFDWSSLGLPTGFLASSAPFADSSVPVVAISEEVSRN